MYTRFFSLAFNSKMLWLVSHLFYLCADTVCDGGGETPLVESDISGYFSLPFTTCVAFGEWFMTCKPPVLFSKMLVIRVLNSKMLRGN